MEQFKFGYIYSLCITYDYIQTVIATFPPSILFPCKKPTLYIHQNYLNVLIFLGGEIIALYWIKFWGVFICEKWLLKTLYVL